MKEEAVARVAKYWRFHGVLARVTLAFAVPASTGALSLIWTGTTVTGVTGAVSIAFFGMLFGFGMLWYADRHPESVLEGTELLQYHVIHTKGHAPQLASAPVETIEAVPVIEQLQAPQGAEEGVTVTDHVDTEIKS